MPVKKKTKATDPSALRVEEFKSGQRYQVLVDWSEPVDPFFQVSQMRHALAKGEVLRFRGPNMGYAVFYDPTGKVVYLKPRTAFRVMGRVAAVQDAEAALCKK